MRYLITVILLCCSLSSAAQNKRIDSLKRLLSSSKDTSRVNILLQLSGEFNYSDLIAAREHARQAIRLSRELNFESGQIKGLYQLGSSMMEAGNRDTSLMYFEMGMEMSRKTKDKFLLAQGSYHLSRAHERRDEFTKAKEYLQEALKLYEELGLEKNVANCYTSFGRIAQEMGNYSEAMGCYFKSLPIKEKLNDQRGVAILHTNIGNVYLNTSKYDEAADQFSKAFAIDSSSNDQEGIFIDLINLGVAHQKKGRYEEALTKYQQALDLAKKLGYEEDEGLLLGNMGSTKRQQGKPEEGLRYLLQALELKNKFGANNAHTLNDISVCYMDLGKPAESKKYAEMAIESSKKASSLNQYRYGLQNLARSYEKLGDYKNAYESLTEYGKVKDSIFSIDKEKQMDQLQVQYESEKKEQTINLLTQQKAAANFRRNAYLAAGIFLALLLFLLYNHQRVRSRKNRQMFEKGQEVEKMKSSFFSNISHEFRTPLTLILGPIEMIKAETKDPKINNQLNVMQGNANRLMSLINQILDLSKLESGKLVLELSRRDMVSVVKGVTMAFHSMAESRQIQLAMDIEPDHLELNLDIEKIETVLINLLSNAFKFTPDKGRIVVKMNSFTDKKQESFCRIIVRDTGQGIPESDIPHVFDRFYQSVNARDVPYEGSGIGLALSRELVELHKGEIKVESRVGEGTDMIIILPIEQEAKGIPIAIGRQEATKITPQPVQQALQETYSSAEEPIQNEEAPILLLVEDNESVMNYLKDILRSSYRLLEAKDGAAGIEIARETIPDLVISDVMMPIKNGYEVCEVLKKDENTSHIPIILLTAKSSQEDKMHGLQTKADDYLTKPFVPRELLVRAGNLIDSRRQLREKFNRELVLKPGDIALSSIDETFLKKVMQVVEENMVDEQFTIDQLGRKVGMSRSQIHRKLHALTNQSATQFIRSFRLKRAMDMIRQNAGNISEIGYWVGFSSPSYFSKLFLEQYGMTPTQAKANLS